MYIDPDKEYIPGYVGSFEFIPTPLPSQRTWVSTLENPAFIQHLSNQEIAESTLGLEGVFDNDSFFNSTQFPYGY